MRNPSVGSIDILNAHIAQLPPTDSHQFCFGVKPEGADRQYILAAESKQLMDDWISILKSVQSESHAKLSNFEGYMYKLGDVFKTWKKRYFITIPEKHVMEYYDDSSKSELLGTIDINRATVNTLSQDEYNRDFCYSLQPFGLFCSP